jgi:DNA-binding NarL/FixJ family response regulator
MSIVHSLSVLSCVPFPPHDVDSFLTLLLCCSCHKTKEALDEGTPTRERTFSCLPMSFYRYTSLLWYWQLLLTTQSLSNGFLLPTSISTGHSVISSTWQQPQEENLPSLSSISVLKAAKYSGDDYEETAKLLNDTQFLQRNKQWVVLVDDEESIRMAVGDYLYDQGFRITACADADALLQVCRTPLEAGELPRVPDAIVSDVRMPGTDGMQLLQQIRADDRLKLVPVILLTAKAMTQDRIAGYHAGADVYIPKPFDPEELVAILDNRMARRKQLVGGSEANLRMELKEELRDIKELMKQNSDHVVKKTNVFLTLAEREVLALLAKGFTNSEIAEERGTGSPQVAKAITMLYVKSGVETRTQLVRWAIQTGYVPPR